MRRVYSSNYRLVDVRIYTPPPKNIISFFSTYCVFVKDTPLGDCLRVKQPVQHQWIVRMLILPRNRLKYHTYKYANKKGVDQTERIYRLVYAFVVYIHQSQGFHRRGIYTINLIIVINSKRLSNVIKRLGIT